MHPGECHLAAGPHTPLPVVAGGTYHTEATDGPPGIVLSQGAHRQYGYLQGRRHSYIFLTLVITNRSFNRLSNNLVSYWYAQLWRICFGKKNRQQTKLSLLFFVKIFSLPGAYIMLFVYAAFTLMNLCYRYRQHFAFITYTWIHRLKPVSVLCRNQFKISDKYFVKLLEMHNVLKILVCWIWVGS